MEVVEAFRKEMPEISFEEYYRRCSIKDLRRINRELTKRIDRGQIIADTRLVYFLGDKTLKVFMTKP